MTQAIRIEWWDNRKAQTIRVADFDKDTDAETMDRVVAAYNEGKAARIDAYWIRCGTVDDEHAATINARAAHLERTGAEDDTEGPMNPEHLQYGH